MGFFALSALTPENFKTDGLLRVVKLYKIVFLGFVFLSFVLYFYYIIYCNSWIKISGSNNQRQFISVANAKTTDFSGSVPVAAQKCAEKHGSAGSCP